MTPAPMALPRDGAWSEWIAEQADRHLKAARACIAELTDGAERSAADVLARWNALEIHLRAPEDFTDLIQVVHPDEAVRDVAEHWNQEWSRAKTERDLNRGLFDVLAAVDQSELDDAARRVLDRALRDFRRAGVDRDPEVRDRLRQIAERSTELEQEFQRRIRDGVGSVRVTPDRLAGLTDDFLELHPVDDDGLVTLTTNWSDLYAVQKFAADAALRRDLATAYGNIGWPDNDATLRELVSLRNEHAQLLGYRGATDFDAEIRMIGTGDAIGAFIDDLDALVRPVAQREIALLLELVRADDPTATGVGRHDFRYYIEQMRRTRFDVDGQQVRRYLDFDRVLAGLLDVTGRLFGLDYRHVDVPVWHPEVTVLDVYAAGSERLLGRVYLDLHPRPGKFSHFAQFDLATGVAGEKNPETALVCNFPTGLLDHDDVVVMFHEFGHVLHHLFTGAQEWSIFSSSSAVEHDFVEAPSQMLEEWAWDADVLRSFAVDEAGEPIPAELVARMRIAEEFGKGLETARQVFYTALSYAVHLPDSKDLDALVVDLQQRYEPMEPLDDHVHAGFGHLAGYRSAYYTYQWSLAISKDLFSAFDPGDLFARPVADRYRDAVLVPGGSRDATRLVETFLGRPTSLEPYRDWLTREPAAVPRDG